MRGYIVQITLLHTAFYANLLVGNKVTFYCCFSVGQLLLFDRGPILYILLTVSIFRRFKNVQFEIASTEDVGVFSVSAKFMGVSMEKVELVFQVIISVL